MRRPTQSQPRVCNAACWRMVYNREVCAVSDVVINALQHDLAACCILPCMLPCMLHAGLPSCCMTLLHAVGKSSELCLPLNCGACELYAAESCVVQPSVTVTQLALFIRCSRSVVLGSAATSIPTCPPNDERATLSDTYHVGGTGSEHTRATF